MAEMANGASGGDQVAGSVTSTDTIQSASGSADIISKPAQPSVQPTTETNFRDLLSDEYKTHKSLESYKSLDGLVKSHIEQQKLIGRSDIPTEKSTPEEWTKFYTKMGRPETADKYEFTNPDNLPEGFKIDEVGVKEYKDIAHKLGLSNKQANELRALYVGKAVEGFNQQKANVQTPEQIEQDFTEKGVKMFGDGFDKVLETTSKIFSENLSEESRAKLNKLDNDSLLIVSSLVNKLSSKYLSEDKPSGNYETGKTLNEQKNELRAARDALSKMDKFNPDYAKTEARVKEFYKKGIKLY